MFNVGGGEILVVLLVALLILGPERIPGAARQIGRALAEFRRVSTGVQQDLREALGGEDLMATVASIRDVVDVRGALRDEIRSVAGSFDPRAGAATGGSNPATGDPAPPDGLIGERPSAAQGGAFIGAPSSGEAAFHDVLGDVSRTSDDGTPR